MRSKVVRKYTLVIIESGKDTQIPSLSYSDFIKEKNRRVQEAKKNGFTHNEKTGRLEKGDDYLILFGA